MWFGADILDKKSLEDVEVEYVMRSCSENLSQIFSPEQFGPTPIKRSQLLMFQKDIHENIQKVQKNKSKTKLIKNFNANSKNDDVPKKKNIIKGKIITGEVESVSKYSVNFIDSYNTSNNFGKRKNSMKRNTSSATNEIIISSPDDEKFFNCKVAKFPYTAWHGEYGVDDACLYLYEQAHQGLENGYHPQLAMSGTGGAYILMDKNGKPCAIFKPADEEQKAPNNPRGYQDKFNSTVMNRSILSGNQCYREVLVYTIAKGIFNVPPTLMVEIYDPYGWFHYENGINSGLKIGSLQCYGNANFCKNICDYSSSVYSAEEIHKMGLLDILILNTDRNEENVLVHQSKTDKKDHEFIFIDHGLCFSRRLDITIDSWAWLFWKQANIPFSQEIKHCIFNLNGEMFVNAMEALLMPNSTVFYFQVILCLVKHCVRADMTLRQIANIIVSNDGFVLSSLEKMLINAEQRVAMKFGSQEENCICESLRFYSQKEQIYMIQYMKNIETGRNLTAELKIEEIFGIFGFQVKYCFNFLVDMCDITIFDEEIELTDEEKKSIVKSIQMKSKDLRKKILESFKQIELLSI